MRSIPSDLFRGRRRILLADDSLEIQQLIAAYLSSTTHQLEIAGDGKTAVEKFVAGGFDIVLMDGDMPGMDGATAARKIRDVEAARGGQRATILAFTGGSVEERPHDDAFDGYLRKPVLRAVLFEAIEGAGARNPILVHPSPGFEDLIPGYLSNRRRDLSKMAAALDGSDYDAIRVLAHQMKASGTPYGFPDISKIGTRLELAAHQHSADRVRMQMAALTDYLNRVEIVG